MQKPLGGGDEQLVFLQTPRAVNPSRRRDSRFHIRSSEGLQTVELLKYLG